MSHEQQRSPASLKPAIGRFFIGSSVGAMVAALPILYGSSPALTPIHLGIVAGLVLLCGGLASLWGSAFLNALIRTFDSTGL
ncbi:hypothetical protein PN441_11525 [Spirulina major CS-329]|uniref:hypothetical protein n=1 Tax=Spirulina TaxID=1154 RepID=UPI00232AD0E6|nr:MULTISPECIES: hypothetical protein [Spirulina]MDB9493943.1 hypothetical protein [Spirulina subsalsa CS-330]MDB9503702.1 hypothetical protein [Spirulina major CS-329]